MGRVKPSQRKNCHNCTALEWMEAETNDPKGYVCNERNYQNNEEEERHQYQMESEKYLKASKKCCKLEEG